MDVLQFEHGKAHQCFDAVQSSTSEAKNNICLLDVYIIAV